MQFQSSGSGLGVSTRQIISLEGVTGEKPPFGFFIAPLDRIQTPQMEITLRAAEISLISDLSNPDPPLGQPLYSGPESPSFRHAGIRTPRFF